MAHINTAESPSQRDKAHFALPAYFDELAEEGGVAPSKPRGMPLPAWDDRKGQEPRLNSSTSTLPIILDPLSSRGQVIRRGLVDLMEEQPMFMSVYEVRSYSGF